MTIAKVKQSSTCGKEWGGLERKQTDPYKTFEVFYPLPLLVPLLSINYAHVLYVQGFQLLITTLITTVFTPFACAREHKTPVHVSTKTLLCT
jgi:hypothetical protein